MSKTKSRIKRHPQGFGKGTKLIRKKQQVLFKITPLARASKGLPKRFEWGVKEDDEE